MPLASVVIPTFNRSGLLARSLRSVLNQTFQDFEIIVVNDGGEDDTGKVVASYNDTRIRYLKRQNGGISAARNTGLHSAMGRWVTFLDDDDEAFPAWLHTFNELLSAPEVGIACVGLIRKSTDGLQKVLPHTLKAIYQNAFGLFMAGSFAARIELLRDIGGFAEGLACSHATELALRLIPACHKNGLIVKSSNQVLIQVNRENPFNRPMSSPDCLFRGVNYILNKHEELLKICPDAISRYCSIAGVAAARLGLYTDSRKFLLKSVRTNPWNIKNYLRLLASMNRHIADRVWKNRDFSHELN